MRALAKAGKLLCYRPGITGKGPMSFAKERLDLFLREAELGPDGGEPKPPPIQARKVGRPAVKPKPAPPN